jgi:hypothetical protein
VKPLQFEFELTHRETQRRDQVRATAWTESEAHQSIAAYYGDLYYVATSAHRIRPAHCVLGEIDCTADRMESAR